MNRRGNGLSANTYAPLVDLAPHLADALLTALGEAGVAAYATSPTELGEPADPPVPERPEPPGGIAGDVLDRLYVDVDMKPTAEGILRAHLARLRDASARGSESDRSDADVAEAHGEVHGEAHGGEMHAAESRGTAEAEAPTKPVKDAKPVKDGDGGAAERDEDAIWAEIVAGFDSTPDGDETPWPDEENVSEPADPPEEGDDRTGRLPRARVIKPADTAEFPPDPDDEGHYVPPPPPPLPSADPLTKGAWIALVGGPIYLLITVVLDWEVPGWAAFLAVAAFIGGFVTLVLRMGDEPRDPDDGAVV
ncbi:hypothetical protein BZB76_3145 [Actinomadura pelletieri DSM 43383]|uniref:DUF308 domain-containing protein n=1 Tax=Actinomadura pelletieri DSM 43383 TaxID=1120940 RepID=A0A495QNR8_9ACTN|nr:hypothetical protein [Actinomadura pelletieri]RKS74628.1 hypothetical protein BZB76_3145 [Actinomadura pelletieri DSM 43383]